MPTIPVRIVLFFSSYAPLFLIVAMRGWRDSRYLAIGLAVVSVVAVLVLFVFLRVARKLAELRSIPLPRATGTQ